jgi:hypothetical protein
MPAGKAAAKIGSWTQMTIDSVEAKLREAETFLSQMRDQQDRAFGDNKFDEYLSAFVGAGRAAVFQLERKYKFTYRDWRKGWNDQHNDKNLILKSMHDRRDANTHEGKALGHTNSPEQIKVGSGSFYSDKSGRLENFSSPGPLMDADLSVTTLKPRYFFDDRPVLEACEEYLAALKQMVADFKSYLNNSQAALTPTTCQTRATP